MDRIADRSRGAMIGGAAGDALGYEVEFSSYKEIVGKFGPKGITEYKLDGNGIALFSDDTQMTLFTAEGLLTAARRGEAQNPEAIRNELEKAYLAWFATQTEFQLPVASSWLSHIRDLWSRRGPGNTCLTALKSIREGREVENDSKGCGGVMRVAPVGIFYAAHDSIQCAEELVAKVAADSAEITHHHEMSDYATVLVALIIFHCILEERELDRNLLKEIVADCLPKAIVNNPKGKNARRFEELILRAMELAESDKSDFEAIRLLGEGWIAEETVAIALFSVIRHIEDFESCMICAVNHDGDSDSTGAVAGNILGAIIGYDDIPEKFKNRLELRDVILSVADDLAGISSVRQLAERYEEHTPYGIPFELTLFSHMKFTPENITSLEPDEIFVFGSNLAGCHAGGAARIAMQKFGAVYGQGVGLQGQSYAIPTMQGGVETIKPYVDEFLDFAENCDQNTFLVTRIGCGIAGFDDSEIAPLFRRALRMYNVRLPESFVRLLLENEREGNKC